MGKYLIDLHIHTNTSPHAYSTLEENVNRAKEAPVLKLLFNPFGKTVSRFIKRLASSYPPKGLPPKYFQRLQA